MRGTLSDMTIGPTGWVGSCPSLSPDGKTLVFKEMRQDGTFELVAVDVATNTKQKLGETRSVDEQVEWLDNDTILYAVHPEGRDTAVQPAFDIWKLAIADGSEPVLFLPNADSPAVSR
jgi:Tol biopolymer transport system component